MNFMEQAHVARLATFAQTGAPKDYGGSDMMRADLEALIVSCTQATPRFAKTYCSQCGGEFGPGNEGYSHCADHTQPTKCCGKTGDPYPVFWSPGNEVVQCHICGQVYEPAAVSKAASDWQPIETCPELNHAYAEGRDDERHTIAQLCDEEAINIRREGEGCKDARYDWMAEGIEALADTLRGIDSATGKPADPVLAAGWAPIETAPEDENILVATTGGWVDTAFWTDDDGEGRKWWWLVSANEHAKHPIHPNLTPTHWMPLPKHPGEAK